MISVISVDFHSGKFREIQADSLKRLASPLVPFEHLIHDNGKGENLGHAGGVEKLIKEAKYNIIFLLDIDAHVVMQDWNLELLQLHDRLWADGVRLVAGKGGDLKPVRPCVMMFDRDYFLENEMTFKPQNLLGAKFDVGVLFNFQVLSRGDKVRYFDYARINYPGTIGNDYLLNDVSIRPLVFHHWYGTRWFNVYGKRVHDKIDNLTWEDFQKSVDQLEKQYHEEYK